MKIRNLAYLAVAALMAVLMAGCGSGSSEEPDMGSLSIGLTDAPADDVISLTVSVIGVTAKPQNGEQISWTFDEPRSVNLMALQDGLSESLLTREPVPAGRYNWIRLDMNPDPFAHSAVIVQGLSIPVEINVPSDRLRFVNGITITAGQNLSLMIDWDLRRAVSVPNGLATEDATFINLRPAWRVTDLASFATIAGTIEAGLVVDDRGDKGCVDHDPNTLEGNLVYLYDQMDRDTGEFDDIFVPDDPDVPVEGPIATTRISAIEGSMDYHYQIDYVDARDPEDVADMHNYTLAFTCQGDMDTATGQEDIAFLSFVDVFDLVDQQDVLDANFVTE